VADYYSILSKAVSALEPNTASARQRLYERARSAMSAEIEGASSPFDASEIAAAKQGLKSAIERIEAEALPAWLQQPQHAACANDCAARAELLPDEGCRLLDASEIAAAKQGLERWLQQQQRAACANDCAATADLSPEIEGAFPPLDVCEIAAAEQGRESTNMRIEAPAIPAWLQQSEHAACANDCSAAANLPAEIEGACPPFDGSEIAAAMQRLESAIERIKAEAIPASLQRPERAVCANNCPATAANQNEDSAGRLKRLWKRVTHRSAGSRTVPSGQDTWLTDLLERASDNADDDEQEFAPKRARTL
jgi:hypothetical protein